MDADVTDMTHDAASKPSLRKQILRPVIVALAIFAAVAIWSVIQESNRQSDLDRQVQDAYCQEFGRDDPDC